MKEEYFKILVENGWMFTKAERDSSEVELVDFANGKLEHVSSSFTDFVSTYSVLANNADDVWFIPLNNYAPDFIEEEGFVWNEFEIQSLEYADSDEEKKEISSFWDRHLPFLYSVKDGYAYIAIIIEGDNKGGIVYGREPEYEEVELISNSLDEFFNIHSTYVKEGNGPSLLSSFV